VEASVDSSNNSRSSIIYILLFIGIIILVVYNFQQQAVETDELTIGEVAAQITSGDITRIVIDKNDLRVIYKDGSEATSQKESVATFIEQLKELGVTTNDLDPNNVKIEIQPPNAWFGALNILGYVLPFIMVAALFWFVFRQARGGGNAAMSFGQSQARKFTGDNPTVTFEDVAGIPEAKEELYEIVEFLKEPEKFISLGARIPKGVC